MNDRLVVKVKGGHLVATISQDPHYPGIYVEYIAKDDSGQNLSRPRVLVEYPLDDKLRALIWNDPNNEDFTEEIQLI